jgi:hypothetical protein
MKKISILIMALVTMFGFYSCQKAGTNVVLNPNDVTSPVLKSPVDGDSMTFTKGNSDSTLIFTWSSATYGFNTAVNYYVQVDRPGNNFNNAKSVGHSKSKDSLQVVVNDLNNKILLLEDDPDVPLPLNVSFRIIAIINSHVDTAFSQVVNVKITPFYIPIIYPQLYVPGAYQNWSPGTADSIGSLGSDGNYEGYIYMPTAGEFKFTSARDWNHINYGSSGSPGVLSTDNGAGNLTVADSGFYKFNVNTTELTWTGLKTVWTLIGDATSGGWSTDTPMQYSPATQLWTVTLNLKAGEIKFRANGSWALNYGSNNNDGKLQEGSNTNIKVAAAGNYTVILDLSHTVYKYKLIKN